MVRPAKGVMCHSADAGRASARSSRPHHTNTGMIRTDRLGNKLEEQRSKERTADIPRLQLERTAQPVAVGENHEGEVVVGQLHDERRITVRDLPEVPHDPLTAIGLDEPAQDRKSTRLNSSHLVISY